MFLRIELSSFFNQQILLAVLSLPCESSEIDTQATLIKPPPVDSEKVFRKQFTLLPSYDVKISMTFKKEFDSSFPLNLLTDI